MLMNLPVDLQNGEKVIKMVRRHPVFLISKLIMAAVAGIIPFVVIFIVAGDGTTGTVLRVVAVLWLIGWGIAAFFMYYRYNNDVWLITNQRLVDSLKTNPFSHRISSTDLINVQDMSVNKSGILPTMFNFGDLLCQTAGIQKNFVLSGIPEPTQILQQVDLARDESRREFTSGGGMGVSGVIN
jgi:uncharacterized membrane protein YdbT with pleckstrin-like domain